MKELNRSHFPSNNQLTGCINVYHQLTWCINVYPWWRQRKTDIDLKCLLLMAAKEDKTYWFLWIEIQYLDNTILEPTVQYIIDAFNLDFSTSVIFMPHICAKVVGFQFSHCIQSETHPSQYISHHRPFIGSDVHRHFHNLILDNLW